MATIRNKVTGSLATCYDELAQKLVDTGQYEYPNVEKPKKRGRPPKKPVEDSEEE